MNGGDDDGDYDDNGDNGGVGDVMVMVMMVMVWSLRLRSVTNQLAMIETLIAIRSSPDWLQFNYTDDDNPVQHKQMKYNNNTVAIT